MEPPAAGVVEDPPSPGGELGDRAQGLERPRQADLAAARAQDHRGQGRGEAAEDADPRREGLQRRPLLGEGVDVAPVPSGAVSTAPQVGLVAAPTGEGDGLAVERQRPVDPEVGVGADEDRLREPEGPEEAGDRGVAFRVGGEAEVPLRAAASVLRRAARRGRLEAVPGDLDVRVSGEGERGQGVDLLEGDRGMIRPEERAPERRALVRLAGLVGDAQGVADPQAAARRRIGHREVPDLVVASLRPVPAVSVHEPRSRTGCQR